MAKSLDTGRLQMFQVDAFADQIFQGNPAAVVPLETEWLPSDLMQSIAMENQLSETVFFVPGAEGWEIRWFTPEIEVDLCGHATLAAAHVLFSELNFEGDEILFLSGRGELRVRREKEEYRMDFPRDEITPAEDSREAVGAALQVPVVELYRGRHDFLAVLANEQSVQNVGPDFRSVKALDARGVLATAEGETADFVSRCFFPGAGIDEDPVTGSAHTTMAPYWAGRLGKSRMRALQISRRGGRIDCEVTEQRVFLQGKAQTFFEAQIFLGGS